ncbi:MAG: helix-turn-helix domain-containing protein [Treponema sp.]|nr:helix-turn-helix domain-containing protein [Treponema sp.]
MTIYFYTLQRKVCRKIADILEDNHHTCCIYIDPDEFYNAILNMKTYPDLLLLDYLSFNHDTFNIYRYMQEAGALIPLIFYNDPFPVNRVMRVLHWQMMLNIYYSNDKTIDMHLYIPVFNQIAYALESEQVKPYVSLLQPPKQYPESNATFEKDMLLKKIGRDARMFENFLPESLFRIFKIFYAHSVSPLRIDQLQKLLAKEGVKITKQSVYSTICRLRKHLNALFPSQIHIIRIKGGYRLIISDE